MAEKMSSSGSNELNSKLSAQVIPLDKALLGSLMLNNDAIDIVLHIVSEESFYEERHQIIFRVIKNLFQRLQPIELHTVTDELKLKGKLYSIGEEDYLIELTNNAASVANIEYQAKIIAQNHIRRELIKASAEAFQSQFQEDREKGRG